MASDPATPLTTAQLAPSEMVLLHGEKFTTAQVLLGATGDPQVALLHADAKVSAVQLGQAILAAALLANERAGTIRLDPRAKKTLLGLSSTETLFADPVGDPVTWPAGSLEAKVRPIVDRLQADKESHEVSNVVAALLPPAGEPWSTAVTLVAEGLSARNLVGTAEVEDITILRRWTLPDSTRQLAAQQSLAPVQQLLADCQTNRPEVWKRLVEHIKQAIADRTAHDSDAR